jgi:DNA-binding transcriptional regulator YiaG
MKIHVHGYGEVDLAQALELLTDKFIDDGNSTHRTIADMRDALVALTKPNSDLRNIREVLQKTQVEMASLLGVTQASLSMYESMLEAASNGN